jgi:predicted phage tail protein
MLVWNAPSTGSTPQSYIIEAGTFSGARDVVLDTGTTATSFTANGVSPGTYFVRVRSRNDVGTSEASNEVILNVTGGTGSSPTPAAPAAPVALTVTVTGNVVRFAWLPSPAGGAPQTYWIDAGSASMQSDLASFSTGSAATSMTVPGVPAGTYYVRVRAANAMGVSGASNEVIAFVGGATSCSAPPDPPSALRATVSGSTVTLAWAAGAGSPTSYIVEAGSRFGAADLTVSDTGSSATTMVATGVGSGTYFVRVRARNACGTSGVSNETVIVVP